MQKINAWLQIQGIPKIHAGNLVPVRLLDAHSLQLALYAVIKVQKTKTNPIHNRV